MQLGWKSCFAFALISVTSTVAFAGESNPPSYLMAAMGDSITAGFLAATSATLFDSDVERDQSEAEASSAKPPFPLNLPISFLETRYSLSWSTGKLISSHATRLKDFLSRQEPGSKLKTLNVAITGGVTTDLLSEADKIRAAMSSGKYRSLKYVTLLIGNNDACKGNSDQTMLAALHETFRRLSLIQQSEPIRILMVGIPKIPDLGLPAIKNAVTVLGMTCDSLRKKVTKTCLSLTTWDTVAQYTSLINDVSSRNELLASAAQSAQQEFKNLEIIFTDRLQDTSLSVNQLALDCFHPNAETHEQISEELWDEQPWFH